MNPCDARPRRATPHPANASTPTAPCGPARVRPPARFTWTGLLLGTILLAATTHVRAATQWNPFASFESRCAALPPGELEVETVAIAFSDDYGVSLRTLSRMDERPSRRHRTIGLTQAHLGYEFTLESKGIEDRRGGRVCARPSVKLVFSTAPMTVYVAREFAGDDCRRSAIRDHELRHVAVYAAYLDELAARARRELPGVFGSAVVHAADAAAAQQTMRTRLHSFMQGFMKTSYAELRARQAEVDTPEEYARLERRCGPLPHE